MSLRGAILNIGTAMVLPVIAYIYSQGAVEVKLDTVISAVSKIDSDVYFIKDKMYAVHEAVSGDEIMIDRLDGQVFILKGIQDEHGQSIAVLESQVNYLEDK